MKKLKREQLKVIIAGADGADTGIGDPGTGTDPTGPACGGSNCPTDEYQCCYHPTGNYCVTTHCDD